MTDLPQGARPHTESSNIVMSFWHGRPWSMLEYAAARSFVLNGYKVIVWSYEPVKNIPSEVENFDAREIWDVNINEIKLHDTVGTIGPFADLFRYKLIDKFDDILIVDTDQFCLKPYPGDKYLFGIQDFGWVANGVLRVPQNSDMHVEIRRQSRLYVKTYHIVKWSTTGPRFITHILRKLGLIHLALYNKAFYPLSPTHKMAPFLPESSEISLDALIKDKWVYGLQMWHSGVMFTAKHSGFTLNLNKPTYGTFYYKLIKRYADIELP
jgi:hypothetical protein